MTKKIQYLVTGGAGFIGSHIVETLAKQGHRVRVFDNLTTGDERNLRPFSSQVELIKGDLRNDKEVRRAVKGVSYIFHLAAIAAVARSVDDPLETNEVNVRGMLNLLLAARDQGVKRLVYSSSCAVYGNTVAAAIKESTPTNPLSPYAASKLVGEYYCRIFTQLYHFQTVTLRYFNVFGPRQNPKSQYSALIPIFIEKLLKNQSPEIHWDGKQSRDFVFVGDVVRANLLAMQTKAASGETFNVGSSQRHSVLEFFNLVRRIVKKPDIRPVFAPKRAGDIRKSLADTSKAKRVLEFQAKTDFVEGLERTVQWFLNSGILKQT